MFFWPLDIYHEQTNRGPDVIVWGISETGKRQRLVYSGFRPYLYADKEIRSELVVDSSGPLQRRYYGKRRNVYKLFTHRTGDVPRVRRKAESQGIDTYEADIYFSQRFAIDTGITPCSWNDLVVSGNSIRESRLIPESEYDSIVKQPVSTMSLDIEVDNKYGRIDGQATNAVILSSVSHGDGEILFAADGKSDPDDSQSIKDLFDHIIRTDPDFITTYFGNSNANGQCFDFPYLMERSHKLGIKMGIARDGTEPRPGQYMTINVAGRAVVDLYDYALKHVSTPDRRWTLKSVVRFLFKGIFNPIEIDKRLIGRLWRSDYGRIILDGYSRSDAKSTHLLGTKALPFGIELSRITGITPARIFAASVGRRSEAQDMRKAYLRGELIPNKPRGRKKDDYEGALVVDPVPGLHGRVACIDFKSMYPEIMIANNIGFETFDPEHGDIRVDLHDENDNIVKKIGFSSDEDSLFKETLNELMYKRGRIKVRSAQLKASGGDITHLDAEDYAMKVMANAKYGYLGWTGARWYLLECAMATTAVGRSYILDAIRSCRELGVEPLYGDTDSIFIPCNQESCKTCGPEGICKKLIPKLKGEAKVDYVFVRMFLGRVKKKYFGIDEEGTLIIKGFETVRGDWCTLARDTQSMIIKILLKSEDPVNAVAYIKYIVSKVVANEIPFDKFIINKRLRADAKSYYWNAKGEPKTPPAHAAIAARLGLEVGQKIQYVVTDSPQYGLILDKAKHPDELRLRTTKVLDKNYYVTRQLLPPSMRILEHFGITDDMILTDREILIGRDMTLEEFV